ncbi:MAG: hypothetical protein P4N24_21350 [Acidobacteriota bacterium]|nr:hypothetical protein [Acidobacteriota bacterium]
METKSIWNWIFFCAAGLLACGAKSQTLAPVDTSAYKTDRQIRAVVTPISSSVCRGAAETSEYKVQLLASLTFENRSQRPVLLYKDFSPWATERIAASPEDMAAGKYVAGFTGDRMLLVRKPRRASIDDFAVINPGGTYTTKIRATLFASADLGIPLVHSGKYWTQLGIDARPDEFYFDTRAKEEFQRRWRSRGRLVGFVLAEPFPIEIRLDPNALACKVEP